MIIRHPYPDDVDTIIGLFEDEVRAGRMLPRSADKIRANLKEWLVAEIDGLAVGCVSLVYFNERLCELRSLAVNPAYRGNGVASALIAEVLAMARTMGMHRVLALTRSVSLFERASFRRDFVANFPEKVWRDCAPCPFRHACDEVALIYDLVLQETAVGESSFLSEGVML